MSEAIDAVIDAVSVEVVVSVEVSGLPLDEVIVAVSVADACSPEVLGEVLADDTVASSETT